MTAPNFNDLHREFLELSQEFQSIQESVMNRRLHSDYDHGDTALVLGSAVLVVFMTLPGIALFYSGAVKVRHVLSTFVECIAIASTITVVWMLFGYSLALAPVNESDNYDRPSVFGDASRFWFDGLRIDTSHQLAPNIPESVFCMFKLSNAIISCALIVGGFACRAKILQLLIFMSLWLLLIYCPLSHSHSHPDGFLAKIDVLDFAGGNVVHISAGVSAFLASFYIGPRIDTEERFESRNMLLSVWGACFVWVGWFGFNMGSGYSSGIDSGQTVIITMVGATGAAASWTATEWIITGRPSILGMLSGSIAGLVSISAGVGYIDPTGAIVISAVAGVACYFGTENREDSYFRFEDPLGTFALNCIGGLVGGFLLGFFANDRGVFDHPNGAFYGNVEQIYVQLFGILFTTGWTAVVTSLIYLFVDKCLGGFRVPKEHEMIGLDIARHNITIVAMPKKKIEELIRQADAAVEGVDRNADMDLDAMNHGDPDDSLDSPRPMRSRSILIS